MKNLKEIALRLHATDRFRLNISDLSATDFAEALLAEIAKDNEPVAWCVAYEDSSGRTIHSNPTMRKEQAECIANQAASDVSLCNLYTFQPSTEQIENRVAEACAEYVRITMISSKYPVNIPEAIRSGAWNEYLK